MVRTNCIIATFVGLLCATCAAADTGGSPGIYRHSADYTKVSGQLLWQDLEGGFWVIAFIDPKDPAAASDPHKGRFVLGKPKPLEDYKTGEWVEVTGKISERQVSIYMAGTIYEVATISRQGSGGATSQPTDVKFGQPVNGLRLGISPAVQIPEARDPAVVVELRNASDKPILVLPLLVHQATVFFEVVGPDGAKVPYRGPMLDWDVPDYTKAVQELAPGQVVGKALPLGGYDMTRPGKYSVTAIYRWSNAKPPAGRLPAVWDRGPIWTGELRSGELTIQVGAGGPSTSQPAELPQGVTGQVIKLTGDFMPGDGPARGVRTPLAVPVYVFRGKVRSDTAPDPKHTALVRVVQADKDGRFRIALPPGVYTVVALIDGKLYLNSFQGDGTWTTVQVQPGGWTQWVIQDTSGAAF